jgi:hypothetical protein
MYGRYEAKRDKQKTAEALTPIDAIAQLTIQNPSV